MRTPASIVNPPFCSRMMVATPLVGVVGGAVAAVELQVVDPESIAMTSGSFHAMLVEGESCAAAEAANDAPGTRCSAPVASSST